MRQTVFSACGWRVVLAGVDHINALVGQLEEVAGCGITHIGKVERDDASPFTGPDVSDLLEALPYFLSFAAGRWTAPVLPVGFDSDGRRIWEQWGPSPKSGWKFRHSWFTQHYPQCLEKSFTGFLRRWSNADWREALRVAIHWYVDSNSQGVAVEGGLVLAQLAFELLATGLFVDDRHTYSDRDFEKKFTATAKVRMLLGEISAATIIPPQQVALESLARSVGWADGPEAIVRQRNCITHPTGSNRAVIAKASVRARVEAQQLALHYLELVLLWLLDYQGEYVNRITIQWNGEQESVPWAPPRIPPTSGS